MDVAVDAGSRISPYSRSQVWRLAVPLLSLLGPAMFLGIPLDIGCPDGGLGYWSLFLIDSLLNLFVAVPIWIMMHRGFLPGPFAAAQIMGAVCSALGVPGTLLWVHVYFPESDHAVATHYPLIFGSLWCIAALAVGTAAMARGPCARSMLLEAGPDDSFCRAAAVHSIAKCAGCDERGRPREACSPDATPSGNSEYNSQSLGTPLGSNTSAASGGTRLHRGVLWQLLIYSTFIVALKFSHYSMDKMLCAVISHGMCMWQYAGFLGFAYFSRTVLKAVGFMLDSGKSGTRLCGYWVAELNASLFYCFFYRGMFDHVRDWRTFVFLHGTHLTLEWLAHPLRATDWYFNKVQCLTKRSPPSLRWMLTAGLLTAQPTLTSDGWACFMGLDFAIRSYALIYSVLVYYGGVAWLHFGYNKGSMYHLPGSESEDGFRMLMTQSIAFIVTEVINCALMECWFRRRLGSAGGLKRLAGLLTDNFMLMFFTLVLAGHACTNIWPDFFAETLCTLGEKGEHRS